MNLFALIRLSVGLTIICYSIQAAFSCPVTTDSNGTTQCNCDQHLVKQAKQYFVYNYKAFKFVEAWRQCQTFGQRFATVTSEEDCHLLEQTIAASSQPEGFWYIAGTDMGNEGNWVWVSTNVPVGLGSGYLNYYAGQPDNAGGIEHCLVVGRYVASGGTGWNDVACNSTHPFICESA